MPSFGVHGNLFTWAEAGYMFTVKDPNKDTILSVKEKIVPELLGFRKCG